MAAERARPQTPSPPTGRRLVRWALVTVPLAAVAYAVLLSLPDIGSSLDALAGLSPLAALAAVAAEVGTIAALGAVYRSALAAAGESLRFSKALNVSMSAYTVTQSLPGGGPVGAGVAVQRIVAFGGGRAHAVAAVALATTVPLLVLGGLVALGMVALLATRPIPLLYGVVTGAAVVVLAGIVGTVWWVIRTPAAGHRLIDVAERVLSRTRIDTAAWRSSLDDVAARPPNARGLLRLAGWSVLRWAFDVLALGVLFAGFGEVLHPGVLIIGLAIQHVAVLVPVTPGGVGLVEAGMAGAFVALGAPGAVAVPAVLAFRLVAYWFPLLAGVPQYLSSPAARPEGAQ